MIDGLLQSTDPIGGTPIGGILRFVEKFYTDPIGGTSKMVNGQVVYGQILSHVPPLLDFKCSLFSHWCIFHSKQPFSKQEAKTKSDYRFLSILTPKLSEGRSDAQAAFKRIFCKILHTQTLRTKMFIPVLNTFTALVLCRFCTKNRWTEKKMIF